MKFKFLLIFFLSLRVFIQAKPQPDSIFFSHEYTAVQDSCHSSAANEGFSLLPRDSTTKLERNWKNLLTAAQETIEWYDVLITAGYIFQSTYITNKDYTKPIIIIPSNYEKTISSTLGKENSRSLGSIDQDFFPTTVLLSRLSLIIAAHHLTGYENTMEDYKHPFVLYKTLLYTNFITNLSKNLIEKKRPDNSDTRSFFSGHASTTFTTTTFFYREIDDFLDRWDGTKYNSSLRKSLKALSFTTLFGWSTYVGYSRIRDKKHYLWDVVTGSIVGISMANIMYDHFLEPDKNKRSIFSIGSLEGIPTFSYTLKLP
jgi:membrane-associated phospholipid phosphatase